MCDGGSGDPDVVADRLPGVGAGGRLGHFVMDAVEQLDLRTARVNERSSGSEQYPPGIMLGLLIYSEATGVFGSRRIEHTTFDSVQVRLLCGDTHLITTRPASCDGTTANLVAHGFTQVLELAAHCGVLKVGDVTVAIDRTRVLASASKHAAVSYGHAGDQLQQVEREIAQLMAKAGEEDNRPLQDERARHHARTARLAQTPDP